MPDVPARPLDRFPLIKTRDPRAFQRVLASEYGIRRFDLIGDRGSFQAQINQLRLGPIDIVYTACSTGVLVVLPADDILRVHLGLDGNAEAVVETTRIPLGPGCICVTPAYTGLEERFGAGFTQVVMRFREAALRQKLEAVIGLDINAPLQFDIVTDARHPNLRLLREFATNIVANVRTFIPDASPIVQAEFGQAAMLALLFGAPHNYSHLLTADTKAVAPWQVRQAVDYIERHWHKPLMVDDIAAAINASTRSVFKTFKESMGLSPMEYVRGIRLKKARKMLLLATHETSVTGVALACGFRNAGHFARDYREAFGELPSLTLGRSKTLVRSQRRPSA